MDQLPSRLDVIIIGAGAAGIAAGRMLQRAAVPFVILEARERLGGRAWTSTIGSHTLDLGCEWLHSADRNVLAGIALDRGDALDKSTPPWRKRHAQVGFDDAAQDHFDLASDAFFARLEAAGVEAERTGRDGPASVLLEPGGRWNSLLDAISTFYNGAPWDRVSVVDFDRYRDTEVNWRVAGGYGALIASLGADLPVRFGCKVTRVDANGRDLKVETDNGTIETRAVIVTVSTDLLASGAIRFEPALDTHMQAAAGLPLGLANKLYLELDGAEEFAPDTRLLGCVDRVDAGSYTLRAGGRPLVEGYFGGDHARELERVGLDAFADAARSDITRSLGRDTGRKLRPLVATAWASDPYALGSYSHAKPGCAAARATLAAPVDGRIFFAGEATSPHFYSTAHGAWEEGEKAARAFTSFAGVLGVSVADAEAEKLQRTNPASRDSETL